METLVYATPVIGAAADHDFEKLLGFLLPQRRKRVLSFRCHEDRLRALWGELLSRSLIREYLGEAYQNRNYDTNECGKPFLESREDFHFNVTHCGDWVFSIVAPSACGIDCEKIKPINLKMGRRYFSTPEADYIESFPSENQAEAFFKIWTLKESYLKMLGIGLTHGMKFFTIIPGEGDKMISSGLEGQPLIQSYHWQGEYILSCVVSNANEIKGPILRDQDNILDMFK